ncbi:hypothetical protein ACPWT1_21825 [Ramlibacter sp. MMS24-I3-19]|uniref:hypothetical protein n=1 Tax=Ramlibacter sp. MMS24-I3-19 TaxID=3416606 RepID=UPI003CFDDF50
MPDTGDPSPAPGADAAHLARRIGQLAATAHSGFAPAIARLHRSLHQLLASDAKPLLRALQDMQHAVADAQCHRPGPRWLRWLPWLGSGPRAELQYRTDCREALGTRGAVTEHARALAGVHRPQSAEAARQLSQLLEVIDAMDVPLHEAQSLLTTWWDDVRTQRPDPQDQPAVDQLRAMVAEVDTHRTLVQRLESACSAARDVVRIGRAVVSGRDTLLRLLDASFDRCWDDWRLRVQPALGDEAAPDPERVVDIASRAAPARRALLQRLEQARAECTRLQIDEQALAQALAQLGEQLAALGDRPIGDEPTLPGIVPRR